MTDLANFAGFAARWRAFIRLHATDRGARSVNARAEFNELALALFRLQFAHNQPYQNLCRARGVAPAGVADWTQIPAVPTPAFKELELTSLPAAERTTVFHSSGTSAQRPSRHYHSAESLALYEASLVPWFQGHLLPEASVDAGLVDGFRFVSLTPAPQDAPHSSLVHMLDTVRAACAPQGWRFTGRRGADGAWSQDLPATVAALREAGASARPVVLFGTAFSFVHLLDHCGAAGLRFALPAGSRAMETGGYKGRSRALPKAELHALITERLGLPPSHLVCEYGMSELSSQAYDRVAGDTSHLSPLTSHFQFPPWARARVVSPETGREVAEGETGLLQVFDLANVRSVLAVQTEDLAVRHGDGFELLGRAAQVEPRGCSLMAA